MNRAIEIIEALLAEAKRKHKLDKTCYGIAHNESRHSFATVEAYKEALKKLKEEVQNA